MTRIGHFGVVTLAALATACGSSDDETGGSGDTTCVDPAGCDTVCDDPAGCDDPMAMSTGHPPCTADSPLHEPCEDEFGAVLCPTNSGYPGDDMALCDLGEDEGIFLHYGPKDYDDPDEVALFLLDAGDEDENCTYVATPNTEDRFVKSYRGRMRPNSHHMILRTDPLANFTLTDEPQVCDFTQFIDGRWLVGSQDPQIDLAVGGSLLGDGAVFEPVEGDPDYGLGQRIVANLPVQFDMHYTNPTTEAILREGWIWFDYVDEAEVETLVDMITFFQGAIDVQPNASFTTSRAACTADTDRYVGLITGHAHTTLTRFSVWHDKPEGEELVYETYNWAEPGNLFYSDLVENPPPNPDTLSHGGSSGYLFVKAGETISFECEYFNPHPYAISLGETNDDEMCNVFGMYYPTDGDVWNCVCLGDSCG